MYKWYIGVEIDGKMEVIRSNKDSYEEAKREIEQLHPNAQILGYAGVAKIIQN